MPPLVASVTPTVRVRAITVWFAASSAAVGVGMLLGPALLAGPGHAFAEVLVWGCAAAGIVAATLTWCVVSGVVRAVLLGSTGPRAIGPLRALVLVACGVAALGSPAAAQAPAGPGATTEERHALTGLPLPDRPTAVRNSAGAASPPERAVTVRPGDTLWALAHDQLGQGATNAAIADHVRTLHRRNAAVIGADPDLILPGQHLQLPPTPRRDHP